MESSAVLEKKRKLSALSRAEGSADFGEGLGAAKVKAGAETKLEKPTCTDRLAYSGGGRGQNRGERQGSMAYPLVSNKKSNGPG